MKNRPSILSKFNLIFIFIVLGGFFLRIYSIGSNPPSLNWDEVSHGYNAYSILKTGRDEWGKSFPLIFRAYGDFKLPLYIYLTVPIIRLFGLNALGVRLISILSGTGLIVVSYFLAKKLTKSRVGGLLAAFITATMPWALFLSRVAVEANLAVFLFSLGWLMFFNNYYLATSIFWSLSVYSYNSARVLVPVAGVILLTKLLQQRKFKKLGLTAVVFVLFALPVVSQFFSQSGRARLYWVNIVDQGVVNQINERRGSSSLPFIFKKLLFNRPTYFATTAFKNYLKHFSPRWLFFRGGENYQFSFPGHELIYLITAPFLIYGVYLLIREKKYLWLFWLAVSFVPSAITKDSPHVLRSILILPVPAIISAYGLIEVKNFLRKSKSKLGGWAVIAAFIGITLVSFGSWWNQYWQIYRANYSWSWQYGYKQAVNYVKENYGKYDKIIFTKRYGEPHEFILFHWPWKPSYYQNDPDKKWDYHTHWYWVDGFDKFQFWNNWEIKEKLKVSDEEEKILLVTSPGNYIEGGKLVREIDFLHGETAFEIISYEK